MTDAIKLAMEALEAVTMDAVSVGAGENAISDIARTKAEAALAALRAQPNHIVDASEMVDHSELVKQEREACAVVCDGFAESSQYQTQRKLAMWCASEIRKRGKAIGETK